MQSFHHSRGRVFFEVLCALAISASCAGAWLQTGATALLPAAFVAALYGLVHLFDMRRPKPSAAAPRSVESAPKREMVIPAAKPTPVPPPLAELQLTADHSTDEVEKAEPVAARPSKPRRTKTALKGSRRRASAREEARVAEIAPLEELNVIEQAPPEAERVVDLVPPEEETVTELPPVEESNVTQLMPPEEAAAPQRQDESAPIPLTPLFEPKPFVRLQRAAFGRKS